MCQREEFEDRLVAALQPVRAGFVSAVLYTFMSAGLAATLADHPASVKELAGQHDLDPWRLEGLLLFLQNEGYLSRDGDRFVLTAEGQAVREFEPWYTLLVGGYGSTLTQLGRALAAGADYADRNGTEVGRGSCGISNYDAIPLVLSMIEDAKLRPKRLIDLGCGDGSFLITLVSELHHARGDAEVRGVCVDPHPPSIEAARHAADALGLAGRFEFVTATAQDFVNDQLPRTGGRGDCYLASFALQEALEQDGEAALIGTLRALFERAPEAHLIVVEVEDQFANHDVMRTGLARAYYNPYFLLHRFTAQRLESKAYWSELFSKAGLRCVASRMVDPAVDATGFEFGYVLAAS